MTNIETELVAALYLLYATDCIHWLTPEEDAYTRSSSLGWKRHRATQLSFTLLGRRPVLVDPFLLRPGFVRSKTALPRTPHLDRALQRTAMRLNALWLTDIQCRVQAMLLLFYAPGIIWLNRLSALWPELLILLALSHALLLLSFMIALRKHKETNILRAMAPILFNPLGATRSMEVLSQVLLEKEASPRRDNGRAKRVKQMPGGH